MFITNITNAGAPKPIGIGNIVIMPGDSVEVPDEVAYVDEFDKAGRKTGNKAILPAIVLLKGMNQITYEERKAVEKKVVEEKQESVSEEDAAVEEKPRRGRKKAE